MGNKEIKAAFGYLETEQKHLTPYQVSFIKSLKKYYNWKRTLSGRQIECLENILKSIPSEVSD
jgi:uncharacterized protein YvpB